MNSPATHTDLINLFHEFRDFRLPKSSDGIPDYTASGMSAQHAELKHFQQRLADMDISKWPVNEQVDYHIVRAEMNGLEFNHRVIRPWSRDPGFYCTFPRFEETMSGAVSIPWNMPLSSDDLDTFITAVRKLPAILAQSKDNLTEIAADLALLGLTMQKREREVWKKFAEKANEHHPELPADVERVIEAIDDFTAWLQANENRFLPNAGIGEENWNWFMKNVYLFPYTWQESLAIVERELERAEAGMRMEEFRNRNLPELPTAHSPEEHLALFDEGMDRLMSFLDETQIFKDMEFLKPKPRPQRFWPADLEKLDFFQEVLCRYVLPLHAHDVCGHAHDSRRYELETRPLRGDDHPYHIAGLRAEGLATGIEEILMQIGLLENQPRARELTYILISFRAARAAAALRMQANMLDFNGALEHAAKYTARGYSRHVDTDLLWGDVELYLRQPGYGTGYLMGKVQLDKYIADYSRVKGNDFSLQQCFTDFLYAGFIPISLIRWEVTGLTDEMEKLLA